MWKWYFLKLKWYLRLAKFYPMPTVPVYLQVYIFLCCYKIIQKLGENHMPEIFDKNAYKKSFPRGLSDRTDKRWKSGSFNWPVYDK